MKILIKRHIITKILKLDENNQYGFAMTKANESYDCFIMAQTQSPSQNSRFGRQDWTSLC